MERRTTEFTICGDMFYLLVSCGAICIRVDKTEVSFPPINKTVQLWLATINSASEPYFEFWVMFNVRFSGNHTFYLGPFFLLWWLLWITLT